MSLVQVPENKEDEMLQMFCDNSMFTFEGLDIEPRKKVSKELEKFFKEAGFEGKNFIAYWFKGSVMNRCYGLTGDNAYPDDLTFVVVPEYYNPIVKLQMGARWFDDIVANNAIRQNAINTGLEPDYK